MPQISPISWTLIVISLIMFLSVINSNIINTNGTNNLNNTVNLEKNNINW